MSAYSDAILALNPVGYWRLGETSGSTAADESSNNNDGTYTNVTLDQPSLLVTDTADPAIRFNGGASVTKVQVPRITAYEITNSLSFCFWMVPTSNSMGTNRAPLSYNQTDQDPWPWGFHFSGSAGFEDDYSFVTGHGATRHHLYGAGPLHGSPSSSGPGEEFPLDEAAFVACTYDGTTKKIYKNGCLISYVDPGLGNITGYNSSNTLKMGMHYGHDASWNWPGYLDEVAIFDTVLSEAQIQNLMIQARNFLPPGCFGGIASISEYSDSDLIVPGTIGPPEVQEHEVEESDDVEWAEEDPGGFLEGRLTRPLHILELSPIQYFDDVFYRFNGVEWYRGRVEKISRRSDPSGMWVDYTLAGWIQNSQADRLYWGRIQDKRLDAWVGHAGVGPGGYVDQYQVSEVNMGFPDGNPAPNIQITLPAGTNVGQPAGGVVQFDWQTDPNSPAPEIERIRGSWSVNQIIAGCFFQIVAYHPIGSYAPPTVIYDEPHTGGGHTFTLFRDDVVVSPPNEAVIPEGTWRLLIRPYAFKAAVTNVAEPGLVVNLWDFSIGQLPTALPMRPAAVVQEVVESSCPALDTSEIPTDDDTAVNGLVYETPTQQTLIFEEMLRYEPPGWTYWVREKLPNGRYRFFFGPRSDDVKYEVSDVEIASIGGDAEPLCNRVTVSFLDYLDRPATLVKEQTIDLLDDISENIMTPFVRERHISVGKLRGLSYQENLTNAGLIADAYLAESAEPAQVGQFRIIGEQVTDLDTSQQIDFREIQSGYLIRVTDSGTGDAAVWRIRRVEKALGMRMEAQVIVGKGAANLDAVIARLQEPSPG